MSLKSSVLGVQNPEAIRGRSNDQTDEILEDKASPIDVWVTICEGPCTTPDDSEACITSAPELTGWVNVVFVNSVRRRWYRGACKVSSSDLGGKIQEEKRQIGELSWGL